MIRKKSAWVLIALLGACGTNPRKSNLPDDPEKLWGENGLKGPADFASLKTESKRSIAYFEEVTKVFKHPRCANCHPSDGRPLQGDRQLTHRPPVHGGKDGKGVTALRCVSCHQTENQTGTVVPGAPGWHLAPASMVFVGASTSEICHRIKDPKQNGGKSLEEVAHHVASDALVAWGYAPGNEREPAPGSPRLAAALISAWIKTGAVCPEK